MSKGCLGSCISFLFGEDLLKENHLGFATIPLDAGRRLEQLEQERSQVDPKEGHELEVEGQEQEEQRFHGPYETKMNTRRHALKMIGELGDSDDDEAGVGGAGRPLYLPPVRCGASFCPTSGEFFWSIFNLIF